MISLRDVAEAVLHLGAVAICAAAVWSAEAIAPWAMLAASAVLICQWAACAASLRRRLAGGGLAAWLFGALVMTPPAAYRAREQSPPPPPPWMRRHRLLAFLLNCSGLAAVWRNLADIVAHAAGRAPASGRARMVAQARGLLLFYWLAAIGLILEGGELAFYLGALPFLAAQPLAQIVLRRGAPG